MKTVKALALLLVLFVVFGLSGGALFLLGARQYTLLKGVYSDSQLDHVMAVLKMEPDHFEKVVAELLEKERKPISEREADLFADRERLETEWNRFNHEKQQWIQSSDEERTFLRATRNAMEDERKRLDGIREAVETREKKLAAREAVIIGEVYTHWLDALRKLKAPEVARLIVDRTAEEISQDLLQLKPATAGAVLLEFQQMRNGLVDQREIDFLSAKIASIKELLRDGGMRLVKSN